MPKPKHGVIFDALLLPVAYKHYTTNIQITCMPKGIYAGPRSAVGRAPDLSVRGPGFDTRSGHILSFLLPLIQEGQLSVTGKGMCPSTG